LLTYLHDVVTPLHRYRDVYDPLEPVSCCTVYDVGNFVDYTVASKEPHDVGTEAGANVSPSVYQLVYVSAVEHPEHFWMQTLNERSTQLDTLISEMTSFYETQV